MKIMLNDQWVILPEKAKLSDLLAIYEVQEKSFAIAVNYQFVPRPFYAMRELQDQDIVDIIVPMQGG